MFRYQFLSECVSLLVIFRFGDNKQGIRDYDMYTVICAFHCFKNTSSVNL